MTQHLANPTSTKMADKMPDGTVYAGISPGTHQPMYATPADAPMLMHLDAAQGYANRLKAHGHKDWHLPTKAELNVLFNNRAAIGGFNLMGTDLAGWYWSTSKGLAGAAWEQRFSDGDQDGNCNGVLRHSVRCVR